MATATTTRVVDVPRIAASEAAMEQLRDGLSNAEAESHEGNRHPERGELSDYDQERASFTYEREVLDPAIAEIAPEMAAMLEAAIAKRLPWTWEPER